jgi:predicted amidohydrolase
MGTKLAVAQVDPVPGNIEANLARIADFVQTAKQQGAQAVLFPELFTTGASFISEHTSAALDARDVAEPVPGHSTEHLAELAAENAIIIYGSILEQRGDRIYNTGVLLSPSQGLLAAYRKIHLTPREKRILTPGTEPIAVDTDVGRIGLTVCNDIMFPEYIRGLVLQGAQFIFTPSVFWKPVPSAANECSLGPWHARAVAVTRAMENAVCVVMSLGLGVDGEMIGYGHSLIVSPWGKILASLGEGEGVTTAEVPMDRLGEWRGIAPFLADRKVELYRRMLAI